MELKGNELLAVVYADLFDWALTVDEAKIWQIGRKPKKNKSLTQDKLGHVFLPGREKLVRLRQGREKISRNKIEKANRVMSLLAKIPTVKAIFLTGSVAVGNAKKSADVDLMIITKQNTLWLTRASVFLFLKTLGLIRNNRAVADKICPNIFLDEAYLEISEKNLYSAHEVLQARCVFDREDIAERWLEKNKWTREYLPKMVNKSNTPIPNTQSTNTTKSQNWSLVIGILALLELLAFIIQYLYQKPKQTNEKIGLHHAFFHPNDLSEVVLKKFRQKLLQLGIMAE